MENEYEAHDWIDEQTAKNQPAVLMVYDDDADVGHVYLVNAPHFKCPVVVALGVPKEFREEVGCHLQGLLDDHLHGKPLLDGQTTAMTLKTKCKEHGLHHEMYFELVKPTTTERRALMNNELSQTRFRWKRAQVLMLEPLIPPELEAMIDEMPDPTDTIH